MYSKIVEALKNAHRMMEHVLTLIRLQADMLHPKTRQEEYVFLKKAIGYMHHYPGLIHYPAEELIFRHLLQSARDSTHLCIKLTEQHNEFNILEATLFKYIRQAQHGETAVRELIQKLINTYCTEQSEHIIMEEEEIFPQAINLLGADDWLDIGCKSNLEMDPLGNPDVLSHHESLYDYIMSLDLNLRSH